MPDSKQTRRYAMLALSLLAIAPACYVAILIFKNSVDVPQWDEWELVTYFEKFARGTLSFADLFHQQNEYRQFFPNLVFVGLGWLTKGDPRYVMIVSFLLACLISFNVYQLGKQSLIGGITSRLWIYFGANLLIFSPIQYENWLQGQQLVYFAPAACLTTALLAASSARLSIEIKFLVCGVLAFISTFSAANGMLCFVVLLPVLAWPSAKPGYSRRAWLLAAWLFAFAFSAGLYFYHYHKPPTHPPLTAVLVHWTKAPLYFLALLGGPFGLRKLSVDIAVGLILLTLFVWCCWKFWRLRSDFVAVVMLAWLALAAYSLSTAALITFGRLGFGLTYALSIRYTTYVIYFPVALVYLLTMMLPRDTRPKSRFAGKLKLATIPVATLIACVVTVVSVPTYLITIRYVSDYRITLLQGKACLFFINAFEAECATKLYPNLTNLRGQANLLNRMGFLRPPLMQNNHIADIEDKSVSDSERYGSFVELLKVGPDKYQASGWAMLPPRGEPADVVLLGLESPDGTESVFAIAVLELQRDFVSALLRRGTLGDARWHKEFSLAPPASGQVKVSAWAFDGLTGKAYRLAGTHYIQKTSDATRRQ